MSRGKDKTKINMYQLYGKRKVKHTTSSAKRGGGGVSALACMAASGTGSLVFIDDVTADRTRTLLYSAFP